MAGCSSDFVFNFPFRFTNPCYFGLGIYYIAILSEVFMLANTDLINDRLYLYLFRILWPDKLLKSNAVQVIWNCSVFKSSFCRLVDKLCGSKENRSSESVTKIDKKDKGTDQVGTSWHHGVCTFLRIMLWSFLLLVEAWENLWLAVILKNKDFLRFFTQCLPNVSIFAVK